jgi:hypothetical protein
MSGAKATGLKWEKLRLTDETRTRLDQAAAKVTPISGGKFHVIRHPFGKIIACRSAGLLFFHVGDGGRPSEILPLAITTDAASRLLSPTRRTEDFDECCELLGLRDQEQRDRFRSFLLPRSASPGPEVGPRG